VPLSATNKPGSKNRTIFNRRLSQKYSISWFTYWKKWNFNRGNSVDFCIISCFHLIVDRITMGQRINSHRCPACGVRSGISRGDFPPARQRSRERRPKPSSAVPFERASSSTRAQSAKRSLFKIPLKKTHVEFCVAVYDNSSRLPAFQPSSLTALGQLSCGIRLTKHHSDTVT
jgi:hypothetical protein